MFKKILNGKIYKSALNFALAATALSLTACGAAGHHASSKASTDLHGDFRAAAEAIVKPDKAAPNLPSHYIVETPSSFDVVHGFAERAWKDYQERSISLDKQIEALRKDSSGFSTMFQGYVCIIDTASDLTNEQKTTLVNFFTNNLLDYDLESSTVWNVLKNIDGKDWLKTPDKLLTEGEGKALCGDYAIAKYETLKRAGFSPDHMRLLVGKRSLMEGYHIVLEVDMNGTSYILDMPRGLDTDDDGKDLWPEVVPSKMSFEGYMVPRKYFQSRMAGFEPLVAMTEKGVFPVRVDPAKFAQNGNKILDIKNTGVTGPYGEGLEKLDEILMAMVKPPKRSEADNQRINAAIAERLAQ
jgi:hypothetical protein